MAEVVREPLPGGALPDIGTLLSDTMADMTEDLGPYLLAGLGVMVISMPIVLGFIFFLYLGMFIVLFAMMGAGMAITVAMSEMLGDTFGAIGALLTQLGSFAGLFAFIMVAVALLSMILAPFNASVTRAIALYQRGGAKPEFNAAFNTASKDIPKVIGIAALTGLLSAVLLMFCYVPALAVPVVFGFAAGFAALHGAGPRDAMKLSIAHFRQHPGWHVQFGLIYTLLFMVASYVPVLGPMFMTALWVRTYRELFGDGDEVVLS